MLLLRPTFLLENNLTYVLVPAYNEAEVIREVLASLINLDYQVVVIDDGSNDNTAEMVSPLPVHYIRHKINLGQGAALQTGMIYALRRGAKYIVTFDADGQHSVEDIPKLLAALENDEADVIFGSRFLKGAKTNASLGRRIVIRLGRLVNFMFTGLWLSDAHNGIRGLNSNASSKIRIKENGLAHASEILMEVKKKKLRWKEMPVSIQYNPYSRKKGTSNISGIKIFLHLTLHKIFE